MKRQRLVLVINLSVMMMMAAGSLNAQSLNFTIDIAFQFNVGDKLVPAGRYTIRRSPLGTEDVLVIQSADGKVSQQFRIKIFPSNESATENKKLIFTKYGDERFFSQIWAISPLGKSTRYQITKSKRELELEKKAKQDSTATQPETMSLVIK